VSIVLFFCSFAKYIQWGWNLEKIEKEWSNSQFNVPLIQYLKLPSEKMKQVDEKKEDYMLKTTMAKRGISSWRARMFIFNIIAVIFAAFYFGGAGLYRYLVSHHPETANSYMKEDEKSD
jgi:hypothetical protein